MIPYLRRLLDDRSRLIKLIEEIKFLPGHFYSPYPNINEVMAYRDNLFDPSIEEIAGIDLNTDTQLYLLENFKKYSTACPFATEKINGIRYYFNNNAYAYSDAFFYYCMLRHHSPERVIEVGTGMSSCLLMDTNELFFDGYIDYKFIDPYPNRFYSLTGESKESLGNSVIHEKIQNVELEFFRSLNENDILFIDSTHVSKIGSDVNYICFEILPVLKEGVIIHFHDIFYPFQYPEEWIRSHIAWNELYLLRAFLEYNEKFRIIFWNHYLTMRYPNDIYNTFPNYEKNTGGSIWLKKL